MLGMMMREKIGRLFMWVTLLGAFALVGCSDMPAPNDDEAYKLVSQHLKASGGTLEVHEALGKLRIYQPRYLNGVDVDKCQLIATHAYWCEFNVHFTSSQGKRVSAEIAMRIETHDDQYHVVDF